MSPKVTRRLIIGAIGLAIAVALLALAIHIPRTVSIFLIAAFIAFGAMPLVRRLEVRGLPHPAAVAVVYLTLLGALVVAALVIIPISYAQIAKLVANAPDYVAASQDAVAMTEHLIRDRLGPRVALPSSANLQLEVGTRVAAVLSGSFDSIGSILLGTVNALFVGVSALILSVFFVAQASSIEMALLEYIPLRRRSKVAALFSDIASIFGHFVAGQAFLCVIVGLTVWLVLAPVHFGFALLVAVICAIGYAVPFVGMIVAQVVAALLAIPQGSTMVVYVTIAIFVIARIADSLLVPKIMSDSVGVSPIGVMFAVFAGGELFGMPGLILGIPAAALLKVLFKYFVQPYVIRMQVGDMIDQHGIVETDHVETHVNVDGSRDIVEDSSMTIGEAFSIST
jgi:predicted PurR-regulated permease PerM